MDNYWTFYYSNGTLQINWIGIIKGEDTNNIGNANINTYQCQYPDIDFRQCAIYADGDVLLFVLMILWQ